MVMPADPIRMGGIRELQKALKEIDGEAQKELRLVWNAAAEMVAAEARSRMPSKSGKARASVKVASSQREARVKIGAARAPYAPWLDFGGKVGREGSITRPFLKDGRYVYPAYYSLKDDIQKLLEKKIQELCEKHGLNVEGGS